MLIIYFIERRLIVFVDLNFVSPLSYALQLTLDVLQSFFHF